MEINLNSSLIFFPISLEPYWYLGIGPENRQKQPCTKCKKLPALGVELEIKKSISLSISQKYIYVTGFIWGVFFRGWMSNKPLNTHNLKIIGVYWVTFKYSSKTPKCKIFCLDSRLGFKWDNEGNQIWLKFSSYVKSVWVKS